VICEYLDNVGDALPMFPSHGAADVSLAWRRALAGAEVPGDGCRPAQAILSNTGWDAIV
jgi:hypothetical protein